MERQSAKLFTNCPWETPIEEPKEDPTPILSEGASDGGEGFLKEINENMVSSKGDNVVSAMEQSREGMPKALIPNFFYKAPFGYPRYENLFYQRQLAASVYVDMVETAIIDEVTSIPWTVVAEDRDGNEVPGKEAEVEKIKDFFENPNTNAESWETIVRMMLPDLLELNSGIFVKIFNAFGEMVEIVARDGAAFTKNPDPYGMYTHRAELILIKNLLYPSEESAMNSMAMNNIFTPSTASSFQQQIIPTNNIPFNQNYLTSGQAIDEAAYFQYGVNSAARPVPFGKREIVWVEKKVRTDNLYGRSAMAVLTKTVQTLIYAVEHNLEYFSDNSIPPGVLGFEGLSTEDLKAFAMQWNESQKKADDFGQWKKSFHKLAMVNRKPTFERLGFTNQELQVIEQQKWWSKLVWACFGLTATELGFTEDAKGSANQIVQSSIAKKRIIYPILRILEYCINTQIIPEFGFEGIRYKYKIFDVEDESKKWELYKLQTESKLKSINEIRNTEGLDDVEWGDNADSFSQAPGNNFNFTDPRQSDANAINQDAQDQRDKMTGKPKEEKKELSKEHKKLIDDMIKYMEKKLGRKLTSKEKVTAEIKALNTQTPLTLNPNEVAGEKKLEKAIVLLLDDYRKKVNKILDSQTKKDPLVDIKGIDDIPSLVEEIFNAFALKEISDQIIKSEYTDGWESSEKVVNQNVPMNEGALNFLQEHTFDNIKGMTEEIANDLKQELSRGIINGEGVTKLKERVNKVFDVGENRAKMIARTEINRAENNGKLLAIKNSGEEYMKEWVTHEDDRTSDICKGLDGQVVGINETFKYKGGEWQAPPSHVNCRSTLVFRQKEEK